MEEDYCKKPCKMCPFRSDVDFKFRAERAEDFAYMAQNPYNTFVCHETAEIDEDDDYGSGDYVFGEKSKHCHGFLALQVAECGEDYAPEGFVPDYSKCYSNVYDMIDKYSDNN